MGKRLFDQIPDIKDYLIAVTVSTLQIGLIATFVAAVAGIAIGGFLAINCFKGRGIIVYLLQFLADLPPVVFGLLLFMLLSPPTPKGAFQGTQSFLAMIITLVLIITPVISTKICQEATICFDRLRLFLRSVDADKALIFRTVMWDIRKSVILAVTHGFSRSIGEVGALIIIGGNIAYLSNTLAIGIVASVANNQITLAWLMGLILIVISAIVSLAGNFINKKLA